MVVEGIHFFSLRVSFHPGIACRARPRPASSAFRPNVPPCNWSCRRCCSLLNPCVFSFPPEALLLLAAGCLALLALGIYEDSTHPQNLCRHTNAAWSNAGRTRVSQSKSRRCMSKLQKTGDSTARRLGRGTALPPFLVTVKVPVARGNAPPPLRPPLSPLQSAPGATITSPGIWMMVGLPYSRVDGRRPWRAESKKGWRQRRGAGVGRFAARPQPRRSEGFPTSRAPTRWALADRQSSQRSRGLTVTGVSLCVFQLFKRGFLNHWEATTQGEQPRSRVPAFSTGGHLQHPSQHESFRLQAVPSQHEALSARSGPNIATQWRHWRGCVAGAGSRVPQEPRTPKQGHTRRSNHEMAPEKTVSEPRFPFLFWRHLSARRKLLPRRIWDRVPPRTRGTLLRVDAHLQVADAPCFSKAAVVIGSFVGLLQVIGRPDSHFLSTRVGHLAASRRSMSCVCVEQQLDPKQAR